jgi:hypothetical protein
MGVHEGKQEEMVLKGSLEQQMKQGGRKVESPFYRQGRAQRAQPGKEKERNTVVGRSKGLSGLSIGPKGGRKCH